MRLTIPTAAFVALLSMSNSADAQTVNDRSFVPERDTDFTFTVLSRGIERNIPVDCERLDENGELTSHFLHTMGIWGHLDNDYNSFLPEAEKIRKMQTHLILHSREFIDDIPRAAQYCRDNFPDQSFGPDRFDND